MDTTQIGFNAGALWHLLADNKVWNVDELQRASGLGTPEFYAAIGWLAREGKLSFGTHGGTDGKTVELILQFYY